MLLALSLNAEPSIVDPSQKGAGLLDCCKGSEEIVLLRERFTDPSRVWAWVEREGMGIRAAVTVAAR